MADQQEIWRNVFAGREITNRFGFMNVKQQRAEAARLLRTRMGFTSRALNADSEVNGLSGGEKQGVAIARARYFEAELIILDEPTIYRRHIFSSHVLFVGDNKDPAKVMGIRSDRVRMICYILMGAMSGLSAIFLVSEVTYFWPTTGESFFLPALAADFIGGTSVFGGKGSMYGTLIGILIIGSLEAGIVAMGVQGFYTQLTYGATITVAVSLYAHFMKQG